MISSDLPNPAAGRRHALALGLAFLCYGAVLIPALTLVRTLPDGWLRILVALAPVPPAVFVLWTIVRFVSTLDEMWRRIHLKAAALTTATVAMLALTYGFLENAGLPRLTGFTTLVAIEIVWGIFLLVFKIRYR